MVSILETDKRSPAIQSFRAWLHNGNVSYTTGWRWERKGIISTVNINGRKFVTRDAVERFLQRAEAGEFASKHKTPERGKESA